MAYKDIILSKTVDFLRLKKYPTSGSRSIVMVDCPYCKHQKSAHIIPTMSQIKCVRCGKSFSLIDLIRYHEDRDLATDEEILNYIRDALDIDVQTSKDEEEIDKILQSYEKRGWCLVPCAKASSIPKDLKKYRANKNYSGKEVIQAEWQKKENRNSSEWFQWLSTGLNVGVRTGQVSDLTIIDFDLLSKEEKVLLVREDTPKDKKEEILKKKVIPEFIKEMMGETLIQESLGGFHCCYKYQSDLRKTCFNVKDGDSEFHIDIENDGGQVIVAPSNKIAAEAEYTDDEGKVRKYNVGFASRKFINDNEMIPIPEKFLEWIQSNISKQPKKSEKSSGEESKIEIPSNVDLRSMQGNRNNSLMALGGIFRKEMNTKHVKFVLNVLNKHLLEEPLPSEEIDHIIEGVNKYIGFDEEQLATDILSYLADTDVATKNEIESAVFGQRTTSENKKRLDRTLLHLVQEEKIQKGRRGYEKITQMEWDDTILNASQPLDFKVPYFHNHVMFNRGDICLIGATRKYGKSTIAMNVVKRIVDQNIKPYYVFNESGGRYAKNALRLGLKDGDFYKCWCGDPYKLIIPKNSVIIYDWIQQKDFARTAELFEMLVGKLEKANSFMIGFAQLRDSHEWFAKDQTCQFVAMSARYLYNDKSGINTYFELNDIRDAKTAGKIFRVPCKYIRESNEVKLIDELKDELSESNE